MFKNHGNRHILFNYIKADCGGCSLHSSCSLLHMLVAGYQPDSAWSDTRLRLESRMFCTSTYNCRSLAIGI